MDSNLAMFRAHYSKNVLGQEPGQALEKGQIMPSSGVACSFNPII